MVSYAYKHFSSVTIDIINAYSIKIAYNDVLVYKIMASKGHLTWEWFFQIWSTDFLCGGCGHWSVMITLVWKNVWIVLSKKGEQLRQGQQVNSFIPIKFNWSWNELSTAFGSQVHFYSLLHVKKCCVTTWELMNQTRSMVHIFFTICFCTNRHWFEWVQEQAVTLLPTYFSVFL